jgi:hypothetical protein
MKKKEERMLLSPRVFFLLPYSFFPAFDAFPHRP